jgi:uncharacterized protein with ATP-grasp and redox domains
MRLPLKDIPEPLRGEEMGTWAYHTIVNRFPEIVQWAIDKNEFQPDILSRVNALIADIPEGLVRDLNDSSAPDVRDWVTFAAPHRGQNWLQVPWFFAEHYFYRRILEATGYFKSGVGYQVDPFLPIKKEGILVSQSRVADLSTHLNSWITKKRRDHDTFIRMLHLNLWGNQADLSLWPADKDEKPDHANENDARRHLLVDDSVAVGEFLFGLPQKTARIDVIVDNAGYELISDLALADFLLAMDLASQVRFHVKAHPTFVSDAISVDVEDTLNALESSQNLDIKRFGGRLRSHYRNGKLIIRGDYFWNSPLAFWEQPNSIHDELSRVELVISKGDANYRRLMGDRDWDFTTVFSDVMDYFPTAILALRTFKAELAVGLKQEQVAGLDKEDPTWLTNGRWGVIQFHG